MSNFWCWEGGAGWGHKEKTRVLRSFRFQRRKQIGSSAKNLQRKKNKKIKTFTKAARYGAAKQASNSSSIDPVTSATYRSSQSAPSKYCHVLFFRTAMNEGRKLKQHRGPQKQPIRAGTECQKSKLPLGLLLIFSIDGILYTSNLHYSIHTCGDCNDPFPFPVL